MAILAARLTRPARHGGTQLSGWAESAAAGHVQEHRADDLIGGDQRGCQRQLTVDNGELAPAQGSLTGPQADVGDGERDRAGIEYQVDGCAARSSGQRGRRTVVRALTHEGAVRLT